MLNRDRLKSGVLRLLTWIMVPFMIPVFLEIKKLRKLIIMTTEATLAQLAASETVLVALKTKIEKIGGETAALIAKQDALSATIVELRAVIAAGAGVPPEVATAIDKLALAAAVATDAALVVDELVADPVVVPLPTV